MKKIRFAIGLRDFSKKKGGAEKYLVDLCVRMATGAYEVHVYSEHWDEEVQGIIFHSVKTIPFPKSLQLLSFAIRATRAIECEDYDITFGVGNTLGADILQPHGGVHWAWFWRSLRAYDHPLSWGIKFLGRVLSPKQWVQGHIENTPYKRNCFHKIVAISDMVKQDMIRWYRVPEERIAVVYNGVDVDRFHPRNRQYRGEIRVRHGVREEDLVILFVSNNFQMKGLTFLFRALAEIKGKMHVPFKLLILGKDDHRPYLSLAENMRILEEVIFAGSTEEPEKYYGASDLLVHPTFYDACSLTVFEALASGLPVITTASNGAGGVITQGEEGFVIPDPRDTSALVEKTLFFLDHKERDRASIAARHLSESYSLERNWREMERILDDHVTHRGASRP